MVISTRQLRLRTKLWGMSVIVASVAVPLWRGCNVTDRKEGLLAARRNLNALPVFRYPLARWASIRSAAVAHFRLNAAGSSYFA